MIDQQLLDAIRSQNLILFVGAGVSMSLGLPSWGKLIGEMGEELGFDAGVFKAHGDHLALAEYYRLKNGGLGSLRSRIDREWHRNDIDISQSKIHEHIVNLNLPLIYTTNFDRWLEFAFDHYKKPYRKIFRVRDLASFHNDHTQIVKFHGDFDDDSSLVLDETSYFRRLDFESPLDLKLRSDVLGKSVLFIGYSLSDINIRLMFWKLSQLWAKEGGSAQQPLSFVFSPMPNPVQERVMSQWGIRMVTSEIDNPSAALETFLASLVANAVS